MKIKKKWVQTSSQIIQKVQRPGICSQKNGFFSSNHIQSSRPSHNFRTVFWCSPQIPDAPQEDERNLYKYNNKVKEINNLVAIYI